MNRTELEIHTAHAIIFAKRLKSEIEDLKWSRDELAARVGTTRPTVEYWLNGFNLPSTVKLIRLASALMCPTDYLLGLTNDHRRSTVLLRRIGRAALAAAKGEQG